MTMRYKPMLAYPASNKPIDYTKKVFIQPKLDGVRCLIQAEPDYSSSGYPIPGVRVTAYSRTGKEWKNINHILKELVPFFEKYPNVVLDGELYNHDFRNDFEQIISMVRKTKPTDEDRSISRQNVQFHCYDIVNRKMNFETRENWLWNNLPTGFGIKTVPSVRIFKHEEALDTHYNENLANGYEGSIVRTNDPYQCKRSHNLRKLKDFHDKEALILDWVEGLGKRKGTIGKFIAQDVDGNVFGIPVMDKFKYLQDNFEEMKTWVGKTATFTYFERTKANSYRHPLFKAIRDYE